jgi:carbamoyltransferase
MNYVGISSGFHDAAVSVIDQHGDILFAGHSERYSKQKHDQNLCADLLIDALSYATFPEIEYHYYERPWLKAMRQFYSGEGFRWPTWNRLLGPTYHF